jgi:hypothetical protein
MRRESYTAGKRGIPTMVANLNRRIERPTMSVIRSGERPARRIQASQDIPHDTDELPRAVRLSLENSSHFTSPGELSTKR